MGVPLEKTQWETNVRAGSALGESPVPNGSPLKDTQWEPMGVPLAVSLLRSVSRGTTKQNTVRVPLASHLCPTGVLLETRSGNQWECS